MEPRAWKNVCGSANCQMLILLKNPSDQKETVKKTISDVSLDPSNRVQVNLARKNSRHFSCVFADLQKQGVFQQNQMLIPLKKPWRHGGDMTRGESYKRLERGGRFRDLSGGSPSYRRRASTGVLDGLFEPVFHVFNCFLPRSVHTAPVGLATGVGESSVWRCRRHLSYSSAAAPWPNRDSGHGVNRAPALIHSGCLRARCACGTPGGRPQSSAPDDALGESRGIGRPAGCGAFGQRRSIAGATDTPHSGNSTRSGS